MAGSKGKGPAVQSGVHASDKGIPVVDRPQYKYSTQAPIEDAKIAKGVIEWALDAKIELLQWELLALSKYASRSRN